MVRGAITLPHGTGKVPFYLSMKSMYARILQTTLCFSLRHKKNLLFATCSWFYECLMLSSLLFQTVRVAVFAEGPAAEEARAAGADVVGGDELIEEIRKGTLLCCDFNNLFSL
jgi:hypothetical protein